MKKVWLGEQGQPIEYSEPLPKNYILPKVRVRVECQTQDCNNSREEYGGDFIYSKYPLHMIRRKCQLSCPDMRHVKMGRKSREKNSWARECIFSSHRPKKSMKNIWINIREEKFKILLENWSRYRSEEISPPLGIRSLNRSIGRLFP